MRRTVRTFIVAAIAMLGVVATTTRLAGQKPATPSLNAVLRLVGVHVRQFEESFAHVIADENYDQLDALEQSERHRQMQSEVLSLWIPDARHWMWARNIVAVDGTSIDNKRRLDEIVAGPASDLLQRLQAIRDEGARFNIGGVYRNFNDPTFALMFLDPDVQARFKFKLDGDETIDGNDTLKVTFFEQRKPSLVRDGKKDAPASGTVWVMPSEGTVLRTRLTFALADLAPKNSGLVNHVGPLLGGSSVQAMIDTHAEVEVDYQRDPGIQSWVPARMREQYRQSVQDRTMERVIERVTCTATYSNFRRFQGSARLVTKP